ncbi:sulfotransferase family protein [Aquisalimonas asiatica]|uniref:Sulfotransferase family protein n=1 Tax=Aquisalimonas asiatica TaxID=406100 RepID=A0A1H8U4C7_9GAMM|nr:sulfotransferase [Aquisalimonas asiatica]SEO97916.1 Sulfotransferase family protein [Aquisalimonas asiatica]
MNGSTVNERPEYARHPGHATPQHSESGAEPGSRLVALLGMPRSGTTWVAKLMDSHPDVAYRHEPESGGRLAHLPQLMEQDAPGAQVDALRRFGESLWNCRDPRVCGKTPLFRKHHLGGVRHLALSLGVLASKAPMRAVRRMPLPYFPDYSVGSPVLVWKSVVSSARLPALLQALPEARPVLLLRHPCGQVGSVLRGENAQYFGGGYQPSEDDGVFEAMMGGTVATEHGLSMEYVRGLGAAERLAWLWVLFNETAYRAAVQDPRCLVVRYEDVCAEPEAKAEELLSWCGLSMHAQSRAFVRESTGGDASGYYGVYRDPLKAAEKWREELPAETVDTVRDIVQRARVGSLYDF